ncbi:tRNA (adenosine(37)-N6)-dimethylallyltransferase MiaA [Sphingobacterium sp. BN32]|uniref:tRNA (adenosine(37)-N6)-dimethylallyltransferase MiaA n=1 Tax=Sphingobacterium sp. BN32 TaxID=3058432 RepID=UPI00265CA2E9|nr:tRNA (adenosine(37)-N6)-dimethylallyltransferase MiaA [Sphingobacterium sp. BN32]WKK59076.1 tRNA (adenosine(37)-N6)-dimethylallyltransferase MiaA [Sphingobacterium sp. BN32]
MEFPKSLIVVVGPTAVGKTAMAIALAKHYQTSIISADSRQFYWEMSIGTAKPSAQELQEATHYFINSHSISDDYSAGDFEREALLQVEKLFEESDKVIVVGGSGLFVRALCEGLDDLPKAPEAIREALNAALERDGLAVLQERLRAIDPDNYEQMDHDNPQRVVRALEVYEATGKPISYYQKNQRSKRNFNIITVGLNTDRAVLYDRINKRVDLMMQEGLLEEVKSLIPYRAKPALLTVGYAELFDYLDGNISLAQAIDSIKQNSRRYAKRQITWFKKYGGTTWFEPKQLEDIIEFIDSKTKK